MSAPLPRDASDALVHDASAALPRLLEIMRRLRAPDGCPWDLEQDFASIAPYTIEEAHEVADAIARGDMADLRDELGDLLLQVVYHAQMAQEAGHWDFDAVARGVADKMVRRHPHVFGDQADGRDADGQTVEWEKIKAAERAARGEPEGPVSALDGVALGLPALTRALKLQKRAARVGFDWPEAGDVLEKLLEEAEELVEARDAADRDGGDRDGGNRDALEEEFGDLAFVMVNLGRKLGLDPEAALRAANAKFERRFRAVETGLAAAGKTPGEASLAEMDALWDRAKAAEKAAKNAAGG
ncbi:MAG: nucleoside triphosphate pyrophosphohydrolase [Pseudomonadota bacterium]|nr:nucleoside triphosphate pyrophosphohydrolase [Pseudomonadota bacterium]